MLDELYCGFCDRLMPRGLDACPSCGAPVFELAMDPLDAELPPPRFDVAAELLDPDAPQPTTVDSGVSAHP